MTKYVYDGDSQFQRCSVSERFGSNADWSMFGLSADIQSGHGSDQSIRRVDAAAVVPARSFVYRFGDTGQWRFIPGDHEIIAALTIATRPSACAIPDEDLYKRITAYRSGITDDKAVLMDFAKSAYRHGVNFPPHRH